MDNKEQWDRLMKECKDKGVRVVKVDSDTLKDYGGMNFYAAKKMGYHPKKFKPNTIYVDTDLPLDVQVTTLRHEMIERELMADGMEYWPAHLIALRKENG